MPAAGGPFAEELGFKLIEASLSPEVQTAVMNSPYPIVPKNFSGPFAAGRCGKPLRGSRKLESSAPSRIREAIEL